MLAVIGAGAFAALRLIGVPGALGWFSAAALMLGATGYAVQQRARLPGYPVRADAHAIEIDPGMVAFRGVILPGDGPILAAADEDLRRDDARAAVQGLLQAIRQKQRDTALWTGLGSALAVHDRDRYRRQRSSHSAAPCNWRPTSRGGSSKGSPMCSRASRTRPGRHGGAPCA